MKRMIKSLTLCTFITTCLLLTSCSDFIITPDNGNASGISSDNGTSSKNEKSEEKDEYFIYSGSSIKAVNTSISGDIIIPSEHNGVTIDTIPKDAFKGCNGITSIDIPDSITSIGSGAFNGCSLLKSISLPFVGSQKGNSNNNTGEASFGYIFGKDQYEGCTQVLQQYNSSNSNWFCIPSTLRTVTIRNESRLGYGAFYNCSMLTSIHLNDGITQVGEVSFCNCQKITEIKLPNITSIPRAMLSGCSALSKFTINDSVDTIGAYAFNKCTNLLSINSDTAGEYIIPDGVTSIGSGAFSGCISLTGISLPFVGSQKGNGNNSAGEASFGYIFGKDQYEGCTQIRQQYSSSNSNWFCIPSTLRTVIIKNESKLGYGAFYNCSTLTYIQINSDAKSNAGENAFYGTVNPTWMGLSF